MGTRGLYVYKWRGRYYVYYNHWDSYPSGLGEDLVKGIPVSPGRYQEWLRQKRSDYSVIARKLEAVFAISLNKLGENPSREEAGVQDLEQMSGYLAPEGDLWIEWVYVFDLDREMFGIHGACFFHLFRTPPHFENFMEEGQNYWLGKVGQNEVHESITTDDIHPTPLANNPTPAFLQMKPTTIYPKQESRLNRMPAFVACKRLYELFLKSYGNHIRLAQDAHVESDFLFRELVFAMMCFASCSPAWIRLVSTANMMYEGARMDWGYGVILDHGVTREPKEFITRFLRGYHLEGMESGSAPNSTSYWFSGALVYLRRDITSRERFHDAIVSAVAKGKADGHTHFSAIVISLKHFILLKYADGQVQHTKRLNLCAGPEFVKRPVIRFHHDDREEESDEESDTEEREDSKKKTNTEEKGESGENNSEMETTTDSDWADNAHGAAFDILAHFLDATQKLRLKPSAIHNEGVFPNEVYQRILSYVDLDTNIACLNVSRSFREFASETFLMDNGLKFVYRHGKEPECFHDTIGFVGSFNPTTYQRFLSRNRANFPEKWIQWIPAFGTPDGTASMESSIVLAFPSLKRVRKKEASSRCIFLAMV
ncbi:hypothetical protein F4823DRAFT_103394 [Ustulina deusta]|nr:hypothetical protein F4823DRAFT_103394 [Ustulina deusta]